MNLIKQLGNINDFEVSNNFLVVSRGESILNRGISIFDINFQENSLIEKSIIPSFLVKGNTIVIYSKGKTLFFEVNNSNVIKTEYLGFYPIVLLDNILLGNFYIDDEQEILQCRSLNGHDVFWSIDYTSTILYCSKYIYIVKFGENLTKLQLFALDINTSRSVWHYTISTQPYSQGEYGMVSAEGIDTLFGVYDGILWITTDLGHLIGLDEHTGEERYYLKTPNNIPSEWSDFQIFVSAAKTGAIDYERGVLFGIYAKGYWECDLRNPTEHYLYYDITDTLKAHKIEASLSYYMPWSDDEIFFGHQESFTYPSYVGIFNRKSKEVTWTSHELGAVGIFKGLRKIDYAAGRLYVLDGEGALHIFER